MNDNETDYPFYNVLADLAARELPLFENDPPRATALIERLAKTLAMAEARMVNGDLAAATRLHEGVERYISETLPSMCGVMSMIAAANVKVRSRP